MPTALFAATLSAFDDQGWMYREVSDMEVIEADFEAHHTKVPLHVQIHGEANIASVVSRSTIAAPRTHRMHVAELIMRTNKELNLGNFELDWDSGEVLFRVANIFPALHHDERIIATLVHASIAEMDRITPFLGEICQTPKSELLLLLVKDLMKREDFLPPEPEE